MEKIFRATLWTCLHSFLCVMKNISRFIMCPFDVFSVCHSLSKSVTGIALFIFWFIPHEYTFFSRKICHTIKNLILKLNFKSKNFIITVFALIVVVEIIFLCQTAEFLIISLSVRFPTCKFFLSDSNFEIWIVILRR